jgi:Raf kinase inhibitor-like YbhB/YbcL family protein
MKASFNDFKSGDMIPIKNTADGININPKITVSDILPNTKSLVLIVEDPDAKKVCGFTWVHWVVFDIPVIGTKAVIKEDSIPGTSGESTYKKEKYGGPNPPKGTGVHRYYFKFYALDKMLSLTKMSPLDKIQKEMNNHILESCEIIGLYSKD